jgi:hypothetical protein
VHFRTKSDPPSQIKAKSRNANSVPNCIELESVVRASDAFTTRVNFGYLNAKYSRYVIVDPIAQTSLDLTKSPLTYAPKFTGSVSVDYKFNLGDGFAGFHELISEVHYDWRSEFTHSSTNDPAGFQSAYGTGGLVFTVNHDRGYYISAYVETKTVEWIVPDCPAVLWMAQPRS